MRLVVKTDRSFFYSSLQTGFGDLLWSYTCRWTDIARKASSDLQRKYLACILTLKKMYYAKIEYTDLKLSIEGKLINQQLTGKKSTGTLEIAEMRSELVGLMTQMGVVVEV